MRFYFTFILFTLLYCSASAQSTTLSGKVTDQSGKPVPFASIYIKNTTKGASANIEGDYSLQLQPGQYQVLYKAIGYKQECLGCRCVLEIGKGVRLRLFVCLDCRVS